MNFIKNLDKRISNLSIKIIYFLSEIKSLNNSLIPNTQSLLKSIYKDVVITNQPVIKPLEQSSAIIRIILPL
jgi:hypothetical protein